MSTMTRSTHALLFGLAMSLAATTSYGQDASDEPLFEQLRQAVKSRVFNVGVVVQTVGDLVWDRSNTAGNNGFSIATTRLKVNGELDFGLAYLVQTDFVQTRSIIDAKLSYRITDNLTFDAGLFKAPFSAEQLIPAPSIDFVNRSQVVSALSPGRQVGIGLRGTASNGVFSYALGAFNGNGRSPLGNDNGKLMFAARVVATPNVSDGSFEIGVNVAQSEDDTGAFEGDRLLFGADVRRSWDRWLVSAEAIYSDLDPVVGESRQPFGFHATVGYMLDPGRHQILARFDSFDTDTGAGDSNFLVLGYNFWPSQAFEFQANYLIPVHDGADFGDQQLLLNFQVAF